MNANNLSAFKGQMVTELRSILTTALQNAQNLPEMTHGMMVMGAAGNFCENVKNNYSRIKQEYLNLNVNFSLTESEYKQIVDDVTTKVLNEFIEKP